MNKITIVVLVIIVLFVFYYYYTKISLTNSIISINNLNTPIPTTRLQNNGNSDNETYSVWVYLNSAPTDKTKSNTIISRGQGGYFDFCLYLNYNTNGIRLYTYFKTNSVLSSDNIKITDSFPVQQWTQITIVKKQKQYIDCYLNGKLVISYYYNNKINSSTNNINIGKTYSDTDNTSPAYLNASITGESITDAYISNINYWSNVLNPADIYNNYLVGISNGILSSNYNLNVSLLNNNVEAKAYSLF